MLHKACSLIIVFLSVNTVMSLANPPAERLCGSELSIADAVRKSGDIYLGKIVSMDAPGLDSPGEASYGNVKVEITEHIRQADTKDAKADACELIVKWFGKEDREQTPKVGDAYIIFVQSRPNRRIIKLLTVDKNNRSMVENEITAAATTQATRK